jgi:hypothetical protein
MFETIASDQNTYYCSATFCLRLNLKRLMQRYERNRMARKFRLPDHIKVYQTRQLREPEKVGRLLCNG